jgi:uncharacterized protein YrzB (UPF0473 family)
MMDMEKLFERLLAIMETNKEDLLAKIDARLEKMNRHKVMAAETKPDRDMEEMVCQETETSRREEADLAGQESRGGTERRGLRRERRSNTGRRTEE